MWKYLWRNRKATVIAIWILSDFCLRSSVSFYGKITFIRINIHPYLQTTFSRFPGSTSVAFSVKYRRFWCEYFEMKSWIRIYLPIKPFLKRSNKVVICLWKVSCNVAGGVGQSKWILLIFLLYVIVIRHRWK